MDEEIWKDIPGFPNYQVSNIGRVRNTGYWLEHGCRGGGIVRQYYPPKVLKQEATGKFGHRRVRLRNQDGAKRLMVHFLVMQSFVGPCPPNMEVCHIDGDPSNNSVENLRYDTRQENQRDKFRMNRGPTQKLTEEDVAEIRLRMQCGETNNELSKSFGVGPRQIGCIRRGVSWGWSHKEAI